MDTEKETKEGSDNKQGLTVAELILCETLKKV